MTHRVLVAGVGNIFFGDDGFGVEVVRRIRETGALPPGVEVRDIGIRGIDLLYELMDGCGLLVLVDAAARGLAPGTVRVVEPATACVVGGLGAAASGSQGSASVASVPVPVASGSGSVPLDPHGLAPDQMLAAVAGLGAAADRTLLVVCEPESLEAGIGLSAAVEAAVPAAVRTVAAVVAGYLAEMAAGPVGFGQRGLGLGLGLDVGAASQLSADQRSVGLPAAGPPRADSQPATGTIPQPTTTRTEHARA